MDDILASNDVDKIHEWVDKTKKKTTAYLEALNVSMTNLAALTQDSTFKKDSKDRTLLATRSLLQLQTYFSSKRTLKPSQSTVKTGTNY